MVRQQDTDWHRQILRTGDGESGYTGTEKWRHSQESIRKVKEKSMPKKSTTKPQRKHATKRQPREDVNQAAFRVVTQLTQGK
jgi:hypothetical protein